MSSAAQGRLILIDGIREIDVARRAAVEFETIFCASELKDDLLGRGWPEAKLQRNIRGDAAFGLW